MFQNPKWHKIPVSVQGLPLKSNTIPRQIVLTQIIHRRYFIRPEVLSNKCPPSQNTMQSRSRAKVPSPQIFHPTGGAFKQMPTKPEHDAIQKPSEGTVTTDISSDRRCFQTNAHQARTRCNPEAERRNRHHPSLRHDPTGSDCSPTKWEEGRTSSQLVTRWLPTKLAASSIPCAHNHDIPQLDVASQVVHGDVLAWEHHPDDLRGPSYLIEFNDEHIGAAQ